MGSDGTYCQMVCRFCPVTGEMSIIITHQIMEEGP